MINMVLPKSVYQVCVCVPEIADVIDIKWNYPFCLAQ